MKERAAQLLAGADRAIVSARRELEAQDLETAAERACVAMLRLAKACLDVDGLAPGSTQDVCVAYGFETMSHVETWKGNEFIALASDVSFD